MKSNTVVRAVCWVMAIIFPASLIAADASPAMLRSAGPVKVNGNAVESSSIAYVGDRIQTGSNASATIAVKGGIVSLAGDSEVVYAGKAIQMRQGRALISTQKRLDGRLDKLTISPASTYAKFQMTRGDGKMTVAALEGSLSVTDGRDTVVLTPGNSLMRAVSDDSSQTSSDDSEPPPPGRSRKHIPGWIWVVGGVGGIFAGTIAAGVFDSGTPASPTRP